MHQASAPSKAGKLTHRSVLTLAAASPDHKPCRWYTETARAALTYASHDLSVGLLHTHSLSIVRPRPSRAHNTDSAGVQIEPWHFKWCFRKDIPQVVGFAAMPAGLCPQHSRRQRTGTPVRPTAAGGVRGGLWGHGSGSSGTDQQLAVFRVGEQ